MTLDLTKPWNELPLVVIDFETTGPIPTTCEPVEIGAVRFEGGRVVGEFSTLLDPGIPIPEAAAAVHGIRDEMVLGQPKLAAVASQLYELARDAVPVAYNAPFDRRVLHRYITGKDCPAFDPEQSWIDVLVIIRAVDKFAAGSGRHKLTAACKRWQIELDGAHRAAADAKATGELLYRLLERGAIKSTPLGQLLKRAEEKQEEQEKERQQYVRKLLEEERLVWRQYACAALSGLATLSERGTALGSIAAAFADEMLKLERERFTQSKEG